MSENAVIQAEDILLESPNEACPPPPVPDLFPPTDVEARLPDRGGPSPGPPSAVLPSGLNPRQQRAWPVLLLRGEMGRQQYQDLFDEAVSTRTANYDLQDLVSRGLVRRRGRGRAVRYVPVSASQAAPQGRA